MNKNNFIWRINSFDELTVAELYSILQLRSAIFVVEQNCIFLDVDGKDQKSFHLSCWNNNELIAYARLLPPGLSYTEASIGRIINSVKYRGIGMGKELMKQALLNINYKFGETPVKIGAQLYLKSFYAGFGFKQTSDVYIEDGIDHIEMILQ